MIGAGTQDLARGLAELAARLAKAGSGRPALRVYDEQGRELALGGEIEADLELGLAILGEHGQEARVTGLCEKRMAALRPVRLRDHAELWIVVTEDLSAARTQVQELAELAAGLLERERLRDYEAEDTTEHLLTCFEQIRAVHDLADRLPTCETVEAMGKLCLESLNTALGLRVSALILLDGRQGEGRVLRVSGGGQSIEIAEFGEHPGPISQALADGKVRYGVPASYEITAGSIEAEARDALMVVPICFGSEREAVLGVLVLIDREGDDGLKHPFGSPDADLAQSVSTLLGLALGTRLRAAAEKELQIARAIQETLIPAKAPDWDALDVAGRNQSANQVGGDYFDYFESDDGQRHCVVADVSGHNMASAMAMVMARSQMRAVVGRETSPAAVCSALASGLYEDLVRNELFITVFFLSIVGHDEERGTRIRFTNAGHNPPLLLRADGQLEWLEGGGPMIGFLPQVDYAEQEIWLSAGDILVMFTDGVTEATDASGKMFDEEGLSTVVQRLQDEGAASILEGIYQSVETHAERRAADDDITVVVIKCPVLAAAEKQI